MNYVQFKHLLENDYHISTNDNIIEYDELERVCEIENIPYFVYDIIENGELEKMVIVSLNAELYMGFATREGHTESGQYSFCYDSMVPYDKKVTTERLISTKDFFEKSVTELERILEDNFVNRIILQDTFNASNRNR